MTVEKGYDKMKKRLLALLSVLCVASALAACSQEPAQSEVQSGVSVGSVESDAASQAPDVSEVSGTGETSAENSGGTTGPSGATQGPGGKTTTAKTTTPAGKEPSGNVDLWNAKFPGVKLKRIIWYNMSKEEEKMVKDFEAKTGCSITDVKVDYENLEEKIKASMTSGDVIDIGWIYGAFYPTSIINNMYQSIDAYIKKDYLVDTKSSASLAKGGFDMTKMDSYKWNSHYYGFCSYWDVDMLVLYYNKQMFTQAGVDTPLQMVQDGDWSLETFYDTAAQLTDPDKGVYGFSSGGQNTNSASNAILEAFGTQVIKYDSNRNPTQNLGDSRVATALDFIKKMYNGSTKVIDSKATFYNGKAAMCIDGLYMIPKMLADSTVPGVVKNNWEIAPIPLAKANKSGAYPVDWLKATGIVRGSKNPDAVAAFALFKSKYKGDNLYEEKMSKAQIDRITPYYKNIMYANYGYGTVPKLYADIMNTAMAGGDVTQAISKNKPLFQAQINAVLKK